MASKAEPAPPAFGEALAQVMAPDRCGGGPAGPPNPTGSYKSPGAWSKSQTGFMGVTLHKRTQRYESHIWHDKKQIYLGSYNVAGQAARVHDITALRMKGEAAELNFPRVDYDDIAPHLQMLGTSELVLALRNYSKSLNATGHLITAATSPGPPTPQHATPAPAAVPVNARGRKRKQARPSSALDSYDAPSRSDEEDTEVWASRNQGQHHRGPLRQRSPALAVFAPPGPSPAPRPTVPLFRTRQQTAAASAGAAAPPGLPPIPPLAQPSAALPVAYIAPLASIAMPQQPQFGWGGFPAAPLGALPPAPQQPTPWPPGFLSSMQIPGFSGFYLQHLQQLQQQAQQGGPGAHQNALPLPGSGGGRQV